MRLLGLRDPPPSVLPHLWFRLLLPAVRVPPGHELLFLLDLSVATPFRPRIAPNVVLWSGTPGPSRGPLRGFRPQGSPPPEVSGTGSGAPPLLERVEVPLPVVRSVPVVLAFPDHQRLRPPRAAQRRLGVTVLLQLVSPPVWYPLPNLLLGHQLLEQEDGVVHVEAEEVRDETRVQEPRSSSRTLTHPPPPVGCL